jgi:hypothetical protein
VIDSQGNLYGTTAYGGTGNCVILGIPGGCGVVFELSPPAQKGGAWKETIIYSFPTAKQGDVPTGDLVFDSAGNLYGATEFGGGKGTTCDGYYQYCGAVFELSPPKEKSGKWMEKVLYAFSNANGDGSNPTGGFVLDGSGAIYGTTSHGGNQGGVCQGGNGFEGCGTAFKLVPPVKKNGTWTEKILHAFDGQDGAEPLAGVTLDAFGNLYGTTYSGPNGLGLIYQLVIPSGKSNTWKMQVLHQFDQYDGENPTAPLIFDASGNLLGTAIRGSANSVYGSIYQLRPTARKGNAWTFDLLYGFAKKPPAPATPAAKLIAGVNGVYFSTTQYGGHGKECGPGRCGIVFEVEP